MNGFINKIFKNVNKQEHKKIHTNVGLISKMSENVVYGEDTDEFFSNDSKNQLGDDMK